MEVVKDRAPPWLLAALVLLAVFFLGLYHDVGINLSDEGLAIDSALRVSDGQLVTRDFADIPSGIPYLLSVLFHYTGADVLSMRRFLVLVKVLMAALIFSCGCRLMPVHWAIVPALLAIAVSGPWFKAPVVTIFAATCYLGFRLLERRTLSASIVWGSVFGMMGFLRPDMAAMLFVLLIPWAVRSRRRDQLAHLPAFVAAAANTCLLLWMAAVSSAEPFGPFALPSYDDIFTMRGWERIVEGRLRAEPLRPFWHWPMLLVHDIAAVIGGGFLGFRDWFAAMAGYGEPISGPLEHLRLISLDLVLVLAFVMVWLFIRHAGERELLVGTVACAAVIKYFARADFPHFAQSLPIFALAYATCARRVWEGQWLASLSPRARGLPALGGVAVSAFLIWYAGQHQGFYAGSIGILREKQVFLDLPGTRVWVSREEARNINEMVAFVRARKRVGETMMAIPYAPLVLRMFETRSPICYSFAYLPNPGFSSLQLYEEALAIEMLRPHAEGWVIFDKHSHGLTVSFEETFPVLGRAIAAECSSAFENARFKVLRCADRSGGSG